MEFISAFLISLLAGIASEKGRSWLENLTGNKSIIDKIEKAFEAALKKWTINEGVHKKESIHLAEKTTLLKQILVQSKSENTIDKNTMELLSLFKIELMSDSVAYNLLIENYFEDIIKKFKNLEGEVSDIKSFLVDIDKKLGIKNNKETVDVIPVALKTDILDLSNDHFINYIKKEPVYIPRTLINYKDINEDNSSFIGTTQEKVTLSEIIESEKRIVILGSAGLGKSVELKETALKLAELGENYPIFLELNSYTYDSSIEDFLPDNWQIVPEDKLLLFIDGFDEIEPSQINNFKRKINLFSRKNSNIRLIISCRTNFYDLPTDSKVGTLREFKPYYIKELSLDDVANYVSNEHSFNNVEFLNTVFENNVDDLIVNPFFLKLIIQNYINNDHKLLRNRAAIFKEFILSRLDLDEDHYSETINIRDEKHNALKILKQIALAMEIVGVRIINENDLRLIVNNINNFSLIRYCTVFKKEEGSSDIWKFEHNNFQEFLCAELLSKASFDVVKSFISYKDYDKVLPSWFNTVAQLVSILDNETELFKKLIKWLIENDHEVLVNVEREKLSIEIRETIFIQIFDYYRKLKIWIDSNKFRERDLAYFGQSDKSINYTLNIANNPKENRVVRLNALTVLGGFSYSQYKDKCSLEDTLVNILKEEIEDSYFAFTVINTINHCEFNNEYVVKKVFDIAGEKISQYIRAAMYRFINYSSQFEDYVDYYLEGYKLLRKNNITGRDETNLIDEDRNLKKGIKNFKSVESLRSILKFCIEEKAIDRDFKNEEILQGITSNCIIAYENEDTSIFNDVLDLMVHYSKHWNDNSSKIIYKFFEETNTKSKAFNEVLTKLDVSKNNIILGILLSRFINKDNINEVINAKINGIVDDQFIERIYWELSRMDKDIAANYKKLVYEKTNYKIEIPKKIDWESLRKERTQKAFDLLFDIKGFKDECKRIFETKEELTWDELWEMKESHLGMVQIDDIYISSALEFVREFARNKPAKYSVIENWFQSPSKYEFYMIDEIHEYIKNNDSLKISEKQKDIIELWFNKYIDKVNFTEAITRSGKQLSINNYARYLTFFLKKFNFNCKESVLLDMLSFAFGNIIGMETIQFDDILKRINNKVKVKERVIDNINNHKIKEFSIYETHVKYAFINNLTECYSTIVLDLVDFKAETYQKNNIVDLYLECNEDISLLKDTFVKLNIENQIHILEKLLQTDENEFVVKNIKLLSKSVLDQDKICKLNNLLITSKQILGLKNSIKWIKSNKRCPFSQNGQGLAHFENIDALPYLIQLLELSYDPEIKIDNKLDRMWSLVVEGLQFLALTNKENFEAVTREMKLFIEKNKENFENIDFLNRPIVEIKEKYYKNATENHTFKSARNKIEQLMDQN